MHRGQTSPKRWLLITEAESGNACALARRLPRGSGILLLATLAPTEMRRLRQIASARRLSVVKEQRGVAARVHNRRELCAALSARTKLILLSPIFPTRTHPDWSPLPRMRAAALARLGGRRLIALGGMDERRYAAIKQLGFCGWAGISAFRT